MPTLDFKWDVVGVPDGDDGIGIKIEPVFVGLPDPVSTEGDEHLFVDKLRAQADVAIIPRGVRYGIWGWGSAD